MFLQWTRGSLQCLLHLTSNFELDTSVPRSAVTTFSIVDKRVKLQFPTYSPFIPGEYEYEICNTFLYGTQRFIPFRQKNYRVSFQKSNLTQL